MNMHSNVELVDAVGIVLGFLEVDGERVRHHLSDVDLAEAMSAVCEARHSWRATPVRVRSARGERASLPVR